uniref:Chitin-binding type-2 domain-containing protein n=1 Tax=Syphacia muris TaxID=451379 RepID=A0A0N5B023_9BILA
MGNYESYYLVDMWSKNTVQCVHYSSHVGELDAAGSITPLCIVTVLRVFGLSFVGNAQLVNILNRELGLPERKILKALDDACVFLRDGTYSLGCLNEYLSCSRGEAYIMKCPSGTVLDFAKKQCVENGNHGSFARSSAVLCQRNIDVLPAFDGDFLFLIHLEYFYGSVSKLLSIYCDVFVSLNNLLNTATFSSSELLEESEEFVECDTAPDARLRENTCLRSGDGYHGVGCSKYYIACVGGLSIVMNCPAKLRYDNITSRCEAPATVKACSRFIPAVVQRFLASPRDQIPTITTKACTTSGTVTARTSTTLSTVTARASTTSSTVSTLVTEPARVLAPEVPLEIIDDPDLIASLGVENVTTEIFLPPNPVNIAIYISCSSLPDGVYSLGCVPQYVVCVNEVGKLMSCANESLVFDETVGHCLEPEKVATCITEKLLEMSEQVETYVDTTVPLVTTTPLNILFSSTSGSRDVEQEGSSYFAELLNGVCEKQPEGFYSVGCNQVYVQCRSGREILLECSDRQLAFDSKKQECLPLAEVSECAYVFEDISTRSTNTVMPVLVTDVTTLSPISSTVSLDELLKKSSGVPSRTDSNPEVFACRGKMDGVYARNCSEVFVLCNNESAIIFHCQPNHVYDDSGKCIKRPEGCSPAPSKHEETTDDLKKLLPLESVKEKIMLIYQLEKEKLTLSGVEVPSESSKAVSPASVSPSETVSSVPVTATFVTTTRPSTVLSTTPVTFFPTMSSTTPATVFQTPSVDSTRMTAAPDNTHAMTEAPLPSSKSTFLVEEDDSTNGILYSAFSCRSSPDGVYPLPGSSLSVVLCHSGDSIVLTCPEGSAVNDKTLKCNKKNKSTRGKRLALFGLGLEAPLEVYPACYGMGYGVFTYGCSPFYYVSLPRYCNRFVCPASLVFSGAIQKCVPPAYVGACEK